MSFFSRHLMKKSIPNCFSSDILGRAIPIVPVCQDDFAGWLANQSARVKNLISINGFLAKSNTFCLLADNDGNLEKVILGLANKDDFFSFGVLPKILPTGCYDIVAPNFSSEQLEHAAIGWGMGSYQFKQYKKFTDFTATLLCKNYDVARINRVISAIFLVRDLINTPANDLYPEKLAEVAMDLASEFKAEIKIIKGEELSKEFPAVYAVGRGSEKQPVLIDLRYGDLNAPKVVLVGKGVCFDSGGIQLKPASGHILIMKKDMAGAAHVLALARMIMDAKLPVNLRVIIPAVENLISGDSFKPGDVIKTRKGLNLEIMNTDAEGRLILADALALASEGQPQLILDFATLTGAARIALGPDIGALFSNNDKLAKDIITCTSKEQEPVWQMPLYQPYLEFLKSEIADFKNVVTSDGFGAGATIAALVLQQFVDPKIEWAHFDINAYNATTTAGKPEGGEAFCLKGVFKYIEQRFMGVR